MCAREEKEINPTKLKKSVLTKCNLKSLSVRNGYIISQKTESVSVTAPAQICRHKLKNKK